MEKLTKENFWNELNEKYPVPMKRFCDWIDEYKKREDWNTLFNSRSDYQNADGKNAPAPKYHDLPFAMQMGIYQQFLYETGHAPWFKEMPEKIIKFFDILQRCDDSPGYEPRTYLPRTYHP